MILRDGGAFGNVVREITVPQATRCGIIRLDVAVQICKGVGSGMIEQGRETVGCGRPSGPWSGWAVVVLMVAHVPCLGQDVTRSEAAVALRRAVRFFHEEVASHGGYLWRYSGDLSLREGEGKAGRDTIWVQPPGTPAVGAALLDAYETTGEKPYLNATLAAANALLLGQLHSGGWYYRIEFDPSRRSTFSYRYNTDGQRQADPVSAEDRGGPQGWHVWRRREYKGNITMLDDDTTQASLRFLMRVDLALDFKHERIHEAVMYGLASLLAAQYPNGAWSHNYDRFPARPPAPEHYPVKRASYPAHWPPTWPKAFAGCYAINDAITPRAIETMLEAWTVYGDRRHVESAKRGGEFLLLAQMPEPQPAWAQQYDPNMHPVWDRAFEPAAISGRESQTVLETLLLLCRKTGEARFLAPVPPALAYLRRSALSDGRLARFYELKTNRPMYFTRDADGRHRLIYTPERLATHYAFVVDSRLAAIEAEYQRLREGTPEPERETGGRLHARIAAIIGDLDERGAWVDDGRLSHHKIRPESGVIDSQRFTDHVRMLCDFLQAAR